MLLPLLQQIASGGQREESGYVEQLVSVGAGAHLVPSMQGLYLGSSVVSYGFCGRMFRERQHFLSYSLW